MPTKVLVFESDAGFAEQLRDGLAQFACDTTIVDDASLGLQTAARVKPDLILLAIELPRMNGFSVCNKLKRDPGLKDVPLIIMSSDSTEETFEQHRRLRTRAEDYVHKPVAFEELLTRIQSFIPLKAPEPDAQDSADDIILEDDIEIEDDDAAASAPSDSAGVVIAEPEVLDPDADVGRIADAAFESIQSQPPPVASGEGDVVIAEADVLAEEPAEGGPDGLGPNELTDPTPIELPEPGAELASVRDLPPAGVLTEQDLRPAFAAGANGSPSVRPSEVAPALPSSLFPAPRVSTPPRAASRPPDAESQRLREELERHRARAAQLEEEVRDARAKIAELEEASRRGASKDHEVQRLQRELDEVKARLAAGKGGGSAREFLDLREQLNKKDKEIIDLRDQLTHRDKELLALRDSNLGLERARADAIDRATELEKLNAELNRANEAFKNDKEAAAKRADDFKRKADKLKADLEAKTAEYTELKAQFDAELASRTAREAEAAAKAQAELEQAVLATEAAERARAAQALEEALEQARLEHAAFLESFRTQAESEKAEAVRLKDAELTQQYEARTVALERSHQELVASLRAEHEQALAESERAATERLAARENELEIVRQRELEATRNDYEARIAQIEAREAAALAERAQTIAELERELAVRTSQRDDARRDADKRQLRIEGLETDLTTLRDKLEQTSSALAERENELAATRAELQNQTSLASDLAARLDHTTQRLATVENELAATSSDLERTRAALHHDSELLARARSKWQGDQAALERAKDALAAALAQIDEIEGRTFE